MTDMMDDAVTMILSQRRREIAAILARGVLGHRPCQRTTAYRKYATRLTMKCSRKNVAGGPRTGQSMTGVELTAIAFFRFDESLHSVSRQARDRRAHRAWRRSPAYDRHFSVSRQRLTPEA